MIPLTTFLVAEAMGANPQESELLGVQASVLQDFCESLGLDGEMDGAETLHKIKTTQIEPKVALKEKEKAIKNVWLVQHT